MTPRKLAGGFKVDQALKWNIKKKDYYGEDGATPVRAEFSR
jgi:hypothetical protein